jgi:hypothetical protein
MTSVISASTAAASKSKISKPAKEERRQSKDGVSEEKSKNGAESGEIMAKKIMAKMGNGHRNDI